MHDATIPQLPAFPAGYTLSPEFRLAVACSWIAPEPLRKLQDEKVASHVGKGIDWAAFLDLVDRHGIPVQALTVLRRCLGEGVPDWLCRELKVSGRRVAARSVKQMAELGHITRLLRGHGIDIILLKGVCLSQRLYGNPGVRSSGDLDVLVRPEQLADADRLLNASGYRNIYNLTECQMAALLAHSHHVSYCREESGRHLELHWRSHFWTCEEMEEFWRGRETVVIAGEPFASLDDSILFLFLCDHGSRHVWCCMKWLSDIAMMIADDSIDDWAALLAQAERLGLCRVVAQTALLVHWLYGLPLPSRVSELVAGERMASPLAEKAVAALLAGMDLQRSGGRRMAGLRNTVYFKRIRPSLPFALLLKESLMCPVDYHAFPLPDRLFWMYVPLRPFFWFWRHYGANLFIRLRSICKA